MARNMAGPETSLTAKYRDWPRVKPTEEARPMV